jgi:hypothetical protein
VNYQCGGYGEVPACPSLVFPLNQVPQDHDAIITLMPDCNSFKIKSSWPSLVGYVSIIPEWLLRSPADDGTL